MVNNSDIEKKLEEIQRKAKKINEPGTGANKNNKILVIIISILLLVIVAIVVWGLFFRENKLISTSVAGKAEYNLGISEYEERNYSKAFEYFSQSLDLGYEGSKAILGEMYYYGQGVSIDYDMAKNYLEDSCNKDFKQACNMLGIYYNEGKAVRKDMDKAREYFNKAK